MIKSIPVIDPANRHIVCLRSNVLDQQQVEALVKQQLAFLQREHKYRHNGEFWVSVVTDTKGNGIENRKHFSYVYFTDPAIVAAFYGLNFNFTKREERVAAGTFAPAATVKSPPPVTDDKSIADLSNSVANISLTATLVANGTDLSSSVTDLSNSVASISLSDTSTPAGPSRSTSWADYDSDDDKAPETELVTLAPLLPPTFSWPLTAEQQAYCAQKWKDLSTSAEVETTFPREFPLDDKTYSRSDLCSLSDLPPEVTELDVKRFFSRFAADNKTKYLFNYKGRRVNNKVGGKAIYDTYPFVRTVTTKNKRAFIVQFDPNTRDAYYAVCMGQQARFDKNGKEYAIVFVNAYLSILSR